MPILFSGILGLYIFSTLVLRKKDRVVVDFFSMTSYVYLIVFSLVPLLFHIMRLVQNSNPDKSYLPFYISNDVVYYTYSSIIALLGYTLISIGYHIGSILTTRQQENHAYYGNVKVIEYNKIRNKSLFFTIIFAFAGIAAFVLYLNSTGSWMETLKYSAYYRSHPIKSSLSYLKNIAPFVIISSYFAFSLTKYSRPVWMKCLYYILFFVVFFSSILVLFHQAGRFNLFVYVMTFPVASCLLKKRRIKTIAMFGIILFVFLITLGKEIFNIFIDNHSIFTKSNAIMEDSTVIISGMLNEFTFPMMNIANAVDVVPKIVHFRYFSDVIASFMSLIPNGWFPEMNYTQSIASINTSFFATTGAVPLDLITFGYYSFGILGVVIVMFFFGIVLRLFDWYFHLNDDPLWSIFMVAWIFFLPMRVVYGDPSIALKIGFTLIIGTFVLFVFFPKNPTQPVQSS